MKKIYIKFNVGLTERYYKKNLIKKIYNYQDKSKIKLLNIREEIVSFNI